MEADNSNSQAGAFRNAARFWEFWRIWYNAILFAVVVLWVIFTWPHFRPALNLLDLGRMTVLALLANLCYSAAYLGEFFMQPLLAPKFWTRVRIALWILGMLFALLIANYWIADEIYPDFDSGAAVAISTSAGPSISASNMNFPAPFAVVGFLAACGGLFVALAAVLIFWFARKLKFARIAAISVGAGAIVYFALLFGFSAASREIDLARGQEKYFCEIDCHLAYSVLDVQKRVGADSAEYVLTLRTRFDETTISSHRLKDAPLTPSPRQLQLVDAAGHHYNPVEVSGTSLLTPLIPGQSYTTDLVFHAPKDARDLRLLLNTTPAWPDHLVIGDENSWLHKKTYFAL
jgi:hypothetical protein